MKNTDFEIKKAKYVIAHMRTFRRINDYGAYTYSLHDAYAYLLSRLNKYWDELKGVKEGNTKIDRMYFKMREFTIYDIENDKTLDFIRSVYVYVSEGDPFYFFSSTTASKEAIPYMVYKYFLGIKYSKDTTKYDYPVGEYIIPPKVYGMSTQKPSHRKSGWKDFEYMKDRVKRKDHRRCKRDEDEEMYLTGRQKNPARRMLNHIQSGNQHNVGNNWKAYTKNRKSWAKHKGRAHYEKPSKITWKEELEELENIDS